MNKEMNNEKNTESSLVYEPREDTFLLQKHIKEYANGEVLEIGTGSGILAEEAAKYAEHVLATDIQYSVIEYCKKNIKNPKITFLQSDLFSTVQKTQKFDCIIFNPPYLPNDPHMKNIALDGGKKGYEIIEQFLDGANEYLKPEGKILLLFSSLSKKNKIDEIIARNCLVSQQIDTQAFPFETLYVYLIEKSQILKEIEKYNVTKIKKFAKGKRGLVYRGIYKKDKKKKSKELEIIIKVKNPQSKAHSTIAFETAWLKRLNKHHIGPKLYFATEDFLVLEYINGISFMEYLEKNTKEHIQKMIQNLCKQMYQLDQLGINKQEMTHPQKHIIVRNAEPVLIDFERCRYTNDPKNITQVVQFLTSMQVQKLLKKKKIIINKEKLQTAAKKYKEERTEDTFKKVVRLVCILKNLIFGCFKWFLQ